MYIRFFIGPISFLVKFAYTFWHLKTVTGDDLLQHLESQKENNDVSNSSHRRISEGQGALYDRDSTFTGRITRSMTQGMRPKGTSLAQKKAFLPFSHRNPLRTEMVINILIARVEDPNRPSLERPFREPNTKIIRQRHVSYCNLANPSWKLYQEICARNPIDPVRQWLVQLKIPCSFDITMPSKTSRASLGSGDGFGFSRGSSVAPNSKVSMGSSTKSRRGVNDTKPDLKVSPK
jgi:hypothetical protein